MKHRNFIYKLLFVTLVFSCCSTVSSEARLMTDMAGRQVVVPNRIAKIYGTSPVATYTAYTLDPDLLVGLNMPLSAYQRPYLDPRLRELPVLGGWGGQGQTVQLETLLEVKPDIILSWRWQQESAINQQAEQVLAPFGIPLVYITMSSLEDFPAVFTFLGELLDQRARAEKLRQYAEQTLAEAEHVRTMLVAQKPVSVYYAEGAVGLNTECDTSVHAELIALSGGENVHHCQSSNHRGMEKISLEQVFSYDPDVIVAHEPLFFEKLVTDTRWQSLRAVRNGRVIQIPRAPFNWFDRPPSCMRLLGLKWLLNRLHPEEYPIDMVAEVRDFYRLFLKVELTKSAAEELLAVKKVAE